MWLPDPEDITIDPDTGMAFISTQKRLHGRITPVSQGGIFGLDLRQEGMPLIELTRDLPDDHPFHPHGIGLYRDRGAVRLFAVNHTGDAETQIDVFAVEPRRLRLVASIPDDGLLTCPNDLVPIGPEQFYVTNVDTERSALLQQIDGLLGRAKGNVVYYSGDSGRFTVVAEGIACANGIAADPRRRRLYVGLPRPPNGCRSIPGTRRSRTGRSARRRTWRSARCRTTWNGTRAVISGSEPIPA